MIDILMSTYNGSRFLGEQIDSILGQSYGEFRLMIRDDGSVDDTRELLAAYAARDGRVALIDDDAGNLGPSASFMRLVGLSSADRFMLADQDDVWLPGKIAASAAKLEELADSYSNDVPLLVFTDLRIVDEELREIAPSMWHFQRLDPAIAADWRDLLAQNVVTGCTIIANRAAAHAALPFALPEMMHDHWIAVNASRKGHIGHIAEATVLYRQHGANAEGGRRFDAAYAASRSAGIAERFRRYRRAAAHFGDVSAAGLFRRKLRLNLRRLGA